ncbi:MAG: DUF3024 domain-containing protein [Actinomycetota bacterium]|nr:DUF3024 domain-containing protein [Actinomycetota bacterium]
MAEAGDDWVSVPTAARLLGVQAHTIHRLLDSGELAAEFTLPSPRPKSRRRAIRIRRADLDAFLQQARVKPGELTHLYPEVPGPPELDLARIKRFCREHVLPEHRDELRLTMNVRGNTVTLWECRPIVGHEGAGDWTRMRVAQLRYDPTAARWWIFWPQGRDRWEPYDIRGPRLDIGKALEIIGTDPLGVFFG